MFSIVCMQHTHVSSEFEKESDIDTSFACDRAHDDPYNECLVPAAAEKIIYSQLSVSPITH